MAGELYDEQEECAKCGCVKVTEKGNGRKEAPSDPPLLGQ